MKIRKTIIKSMVLFCVVTSCKKDRLDGDYAIFNGNWNYIDHNYGWCEGEGYYELITPELNFYSLIFEEKGIVTFFEDGNLLERKRVVIDNYLNIGNEFLDYKFYIHLNNNEDNQLRGGFKSDTMVLFTFPYLGEHGCEQHTSYFIRE